jgi:NADPH2:quinone reductase
MKAVSIDKFGGVDELKFTDVPIPDIGIGQVLVRVSYAGVNPVDWKIREGYLEKLFPHAFPLIPGWDMSGVIEAVDKSVTEFKPGDKVYSHIQPRPIQYGTYAEFTPADASAVSHMPSNLDFAEAASIPLAMLTAWQALVEIAELKKGENILVCAGAGGVGGFAIQIAKYIGANVLTTASASNHDYVQTLGADIAIDYNAEDINAEIYKFVNNGVDVVFDCTGVSDVEENISYVRKGGGGRYITICGQPDVVPTLESLGSEFQINAELVFVKPNGKTLQEITKLIEEGHLKPLPIEEYSLKEAEKAQIKSAGGHVRGKLVIRVQ